MFGFQTDAGHGRDPPDKYYMCGKIGKFGKFGKPTLCLGGFRIPLNCPIQISNHMGIFYPPTMV